MKKIIIFIVILTVIVWLGWGRDNKLSDLNSVPSIAPTVTSSTGTTLVLNTGESIATYSATSVANVFDALIKIADNEGVEVKTKKYDFGVFVESIAGLPNTKDKSWIYYVNGKSGDVAADKYEIKSGDMVEWKYEKPIY